MIQMRRWFRTLPTVLRMPNSTACDRARHLHVACFGRARLQKSSVCVECGKYFESRRHATPRSP